MISAANSVMEHEPVVSDPEIAAEFSEFKRRWPVIGAAAEHPLTELVVRFSRPRKWVYPLAGFYIGLTLMASVLWTRQHFELWILIVAGAAPFIYADRKRFIRKLFFAANPDLALMPLSVHQYVAIRLAAEFVAMRRMRRLAWRGLAGIAAAHFALFLSLRFVELPIGDLDVLRSFLLLLWCDLNLFIFPTYQKLLTDQMIRLYYPILFGKPFVLGFWFVQAILLSSMMSRFHGFFGVGIYIVLCIYYHAYLLDWGKKADLDKYFRDHGNYEWQFETDKRGRWKWSGRKIIADDE
ncbi:MAG: hypothetical protein ABFD69_00455 [Candidatus Sumerlaeia bacterium]